MPPTRRKPSRASRKKLARAKAFAMGKPHIGYVITLLLAVCGQWEWSSRTIASLQAQMSERPILMQQRNREMDDMKARLAAVEAHCKPN